MCIMCATGQVVKAAGLTVLRMGGSGNLKDQIRVCMRVAEAPTPQGSRCEPHQGLQSVLGPCCGSNLLQAGIDRGLRIPTCCLG